MASLVEKLAKRIFFARTADPTYGGCHFVRTKYRSFDKFPLFVDGRWISCPASLHRMEKPFGRNQPHIQSEAVKFVHILGFGGVVHSFHIPYY